MRIDCAIVPPEDRMTPEERAVIEAALELDVRAYAAAACETDRRIFESVGAVISATAALRASRQPKPRYAVEPGPYVIGPGIYVAVSGRGIETSEAAAERICRLLNEADK